MLATFIVLSFCVLVISLQRDLPSPTENTAPELPENSSIVVQPLLP